MNENLQKEDLEYRIWKYYIPYHLELGRCADEIDPKLIMSVHSFSPKYESDVRDFEIGVLCTFDEKICERISNRLLQDGFDTRINEPWSGKEGFICTAQVLSQSRNLSADVQSCLNCEMILLLISSGGIELHCRYVNLWNLRIFFFNL